MSSLFQYDDESVESDDHVGDGTIDRIDGVDEALEQMQMSDPAVEYVSVMDRSSDGYQRLRSTIPSSLADELGIDDDNTLLMMPVGDDGILVRVV